MQEKECVYVSQPQTCLQQFNKNKNINYEELDGYCPLLIHINS